MHILQVKTQRAQELLDITAQVQQAIRELGLVEGAALIYVPHTTAGLAVNENADPTVNEDILAQLERLAPVAGSYRHGEGNSGAHIKSVLTGVSLLVPVSKGELFLGTWQGIFFAEFDGPRSRQAWVQALPEAGATKTAEETGG
ncbi:MAG: secondary thiamine-phosphate synthase enzyme YjbQ [bacterium]